MSWFDLAFIIVGWGVGNFFFNNFEKHLSWKRRMFKLLIMIGMLYLVGEIGIVFLYSFLGVMILGMVYLHAVWFPKKGINGFTAEPYDKYLFMVTKK